MQDRYFLRLLAPFVALLVVLAGCDSGVAPSEAEQGPTATTVQFDASSTAVTEADSLAEIAVSISNPDGQSVTVEVIFAAASSSADLNDLNLNADGIPSVGDGNAYVVGSVTFDGSAEDGATETITFDVTDEDDLEERETAVFALQNVQTSGNASIGSPSSFDLSIGFPPIADIRTRSLGENATIQGIITRIDRGTAFMQDESGGIALFDDDFAGSVNPGDEVIVSGALTVFAGLLELEDVSGTVTSSENELPEPTTGTLAELAENGEALEATLVRVEDLSFEESGTFSGGTNYTVTDGSGGAVQLRVPSQSFYVGQPIPSEAVTFEGVLSQFNGAFDSIEPNTGYQMLAISEGDLSSVGDGNGGGGGPQPATINEARQSLDQEVVIEGTVTRAFGAYARVQDDSGPTGASGLVIRQTGGAFYDDVQSGTITAGTTLRITGTTSEFNGIAQINEDDLASYEVVSQGDAPSPQMPSLADLDTNGEDYESELVEITDLTFPEASGTFSTSTSYTVEDASGNQLTFRVQSGSETDLGGVAIPSGTFTYTGVVGEFDGTYQLVPILPSDIGATDGGGGDTPEPITIEEARALEDDEPVVFEAILTRGQGRYLFFQDETAGLQLFDFGGFNDELDSGELAIGDSVRVSGVMGTFSGQRQVTDADLEVLSSGNDLPAVQTITLDELNQNGSEYIHELVRVEDFTINADGDDVFQAGGGDGNYDIDDGTAMGVLRLEGSNSSEYEGEPIPSGEVTFEGAVTQFEGTYQLHLALESDLITE